MKEWKSPEGIFSIFFNIILFIYFWLHWFFVALRGFSLVVVNGGYSLVVVPRFSHCSGLPCCGAQAVRCVGLSSCSSGSVTVARGLSSPVACGIGLNPCRLLGRLILNHWTTREALQHLFKKTFFRADLGSQQNWTIGKEISHIPTLPQRRHNLPPLSTFPSRMVYLLKLMNLH